MASKKPIDELWAQLNPHITKQSSASKDSFSKMWFGFSNQISTEKKPAKLPAHPSAKTTEAGGVRAKSDASVLVMNDQTLQPIPQGSEGIDHSIQRCIQLLQHGSAQTRRAALAMLKGLLIGAAPVTQNVLQEVFETDVGKVLLKGFEDPVEACRELTVRTFRDLLTACPDAVLKLLPYAMPVLEERTQQGENKAPAEPSEEVRLLLFQLLTLLVEQAGEAISAYAAEAVEMAKIGCLDPFYQVNQEACATMLALNGALGMRLHGLSKHMIAVLLPLSTHNRYKVRIAAIQAVRALTHQGGHEMILEMVAHQDANVIPVKAFYGDDLRVNFLGKLSTDSHMQVRLECLRMVGDWMLNLRERVDHEPRLIPFLLNGLTDSVPAVADEALALVEQLGKQYEREHEKDLADTRYYLPEGAHGLGWQQRAVEAGDGLDAGTARPVYMTAPFSRRPRLGGRIVVQSCFGRLVKPICAELQAWQHEPRVKAVGLLKVMLVFLEDIVGQYLHVVLPALIKVYDEPELHTNVRSCLEIIGHFIAPDAFLKIVIARLNDDSLELKARTATLGALAALLRGAAPNGGVTWHVPQLLEELQADTFMKSEDSATRAAVLALVELLLQHCPDKCATHSLDAMRILLHLRAPQRAADPSSSPEASAVTAAMQLLATACCCEDWGCLVAEHRTSLVLLMSPEFGPHCSADITAFCYAVAPEAGQQLLQRAAAADLQALDLADYRQEAGAASTSNWSASAWEVLLKEVVAKVPQLHGAPSRMLLAALEAVLLHDVTRDPDATAMLQQFFERVLPQLLKVPHAMLGSLRCATAAIAGAVDVSGALLGAISACVGSISSCAESDCAAVRAQVMHVLHKLLDRANFASLNKTDPTSPTSPVPIITATAFQRWDDALESIQCLAVHLVERILQCCAQDGQASEEAAEAVLLRVLQRRDPGSAELQAKALGLLHMASTALPGALACAQQQLDPQQMALFPLARMFATQH